MCWVLFFLAGSCRGAWFRCGSVLFALTVPDRCEVLCLELVVGILYSGLLSSMSRSWREGVRVGGGILVGLHSWLFELGMGLLYDPEI